MELRSKRNMSVFTNFSTTHRFEEAMLDGQTDRHVTNMCVEEGGGGRKEVNSCFPLLHSVY